MTTPSPTTAVTATVQPHDMSGETDVDLLLMMSWSLADRGTAEADAARAAWGEFFVRHRGYLFQCCRRWKSDAVDIVSETFRKVRRGAGKFPFSRLHGINDPSAQLNVVRSWLGMIAKRVAIDLYRLQTKACEVIDPSELEERVGKSSPRKNTEQCSTEAIERVLIAVRDVLNDREREVVYATLQYYDMDLGRSNMPPEAVTELARRLGMTAASIRQTRGRAYEKLRVRLESA